MFFHAIANNNYNWFKTPNATRIAMNSFPEDLFVHKKLIKELYCKDIISASEFLKKLRMRKQYPTVVEILKDRCPISAYPYEDNALIWDERVNAANWLIMKGESREELLEAGCILRSVGEMYMSKKACLRLLAIQWKKKQWALPSEEELKKMFPNKSANRVFFLGLLRK